MREVLLDAIKDTLSILPLLLIVYIIIEWIEYKYSGEIKEKVRNSGNKGILIGALFGCLPQCGFSVISSALYAKRLITIGTLLAVHISTSDEAIPIIMSNPDKIGWIAPIILTKLSLAIVAGYSIDFIFRKNIKIDNHEEHEEHEDIEHIDEKGCCGHHCVANKPDYKELLLHPLIHTLKILMFIFITTLIIGIIIYRVGEDNLGKFFLGNTIWQPVAAAIFGLIPNCAASVAITQVFLKGGISFGSAIAGLTSGAGLGIVVLLKENKDLKESLKIIGLFLLISIISGIIIQTFIG